MNFLTRLAFGLLLSATPLAAQNGGTLTLSNTTISNATFGGTLNLSGSGLVIGGGQNVLVVTTPAPAIPYVLKVPDFANVQSVEFVLHSMAGNDGTAPLAGLVAGPDGAFYGTASTGGAWGFGSVFRVTASGVVTTLVNFTDPNTILSTTTGTTSPIGASPTAKLTLGADGNFYGTTDLGGAHDKGTIFKVTPAGVLTTLFSFSGKNGSGPVSSLTLGRDGNFYGTTETGGPYVSSAGTVFKVTPAGELTTLVAFNIKNGRTPCGGLLLNTDGNFYGTTVAGGAFAAGTVFKVTPGGELTTIVSLDHKAGAYPGDGVVRGKDGNLYGTTGVDGTRNQGTIFRLTRGGVLSTLATFTGANGSDPVGGLTVGEDGNLLGTTDSGGTANKGTAFRVTPAGVLTRLVSFTGANGAHPQAGLVQAANGQFYGTTSMGGTSDGGVIFALSLPAPQAIMFPRLPAFKAGQTVTLAATASSGLAVSYRVVSGPATVSGSSVKFTGAGRVVLAASQGGNLKIAAAPEVMIEVTVQKNEQTLSSFAIIPNRVYSPVPFTITLPTASSGLPVAVKVKSGHSTISGNTLTLTGVGQVTLVANQPGNDSYFPAKPVTTSFLVRKAPQTITLPEVSLLAVGQEVHLNGTASSGLPVSYKVFGPARLSGTTLKITGPGQIILKAMQPGNVNYLAAPTITRVLKVPKPVVTTGGSYNGSTNGATIYTGTGSYDGAGTIALGGQGGYWSGGVVVTIVGSVNASGTFATFELGSGSVSSGILTVVTTTTGVATFTLYPQAAL